MSWLRRAGGGRALGGDGGRAEEGTPTVAGYGDLVEIGRGGSATVYRAWQQEFERQVALKVLAVSLTDRRAQQRFARERGLTGRLSGHPHVVTVFDAGLLGGRRPYLAMEYFERGSFADQLAARGPLELDEVLRTWWRSARASRVRSPRAWRSSSTRRPAGAAR